MRTPEQIKQNANNIFKLMDSLREQISLLENVYQVNAVELMGEPNEEWNNDIANLAKAIESLNTLAHMEIDYADDLEHPNQD